MRFGISMPNVGDPAAIVELAVAAERAGWHGFFLWDHVNAMPDMHDPWVLLGAVAARTSRVRLGTLVTPVPRRRPWKLAKEVVTLDHLSSGRAVLGVGLGLPPETEFAAFGERADTAVRAAMLDEALPLLDRFLRGDRVDHDGVHYRVHAALSPGAVQRPRPPIWVAATLPNEGPVARARRWDGIFPLSAGAAGSPSPDQLADLVQRLDPPSGFDVLSVLSPGRRPSELAQAGATWAIDGPAAPDEPASALRRRIDSGPPG